MEVVAKTPAGRTAFYAVVRSRVPLHLREDALQEAHLGIAAAMLRHDPARGAALATYCEHRARGQVRDFLRSEDPLTRSQRAEVRSGVEGSPIRVDIAILAAATVPPTQYDQAMYAEVRRMVGQLPKRYGRVIEALYFEEQEPGDLAKVIGISLSMVYYWRGQGLRELRRLAGVECGDVRAD